MDLPAGLLLRLLLSASSTSKGGCLRPSTKADWLKHIKEMITTFKAKFVSDDVDNDDDDDEEVLQLFLAVVSDADDELLEYMILVV